MEKTGRAGHREYAGVALATRIAEQIFRTYFGGDPWVRSESPVGSTDPRISIPLSRLGL